MEALAIPRACAAIPMRPPSRVFMATLKPSPSFPRRFFAGTRTSSKMIEDVADALIPIFFSGFPREIPFHFMSTPKAVIPFRPIGAELEDRVARQGIVHRHDDAGGSARPGDILHGDRVADVVHPRAAVLLRAGGPPEAEIPHLAPQL